MWFMRTKMALHTCWVAHSGKPERDLPLSIELGSAELEASEPLAFG